MRRGLSLTLWSGRPSTRCFISTLRQTPRSCCACLIRRQDRSASEVGPTPAHLGLATSSALTPLLQIVALPALIVVQLQSNFEQIIRGHLVFEITGRAAVTQMLQGVVCGLDRGVKRHMPL